MYHLPIRGIVFYADDWKMTKTYVKMVTFRSSKLKVKNILFPSKLIIDLQK